MIVDNKEQMEEGSDLCASQENRVMSFFFLFQKLKCERKEPCRLFSVKKSAHRADVDEVTTSSLCSCPHNHRCPQHHLDVGVVPGRVYSEDAVRAYSGYCM